MHGRAAAATGVGSPTSSTYCARSMSGGWPVPLPFCDPVELSGGTWVCSRWLPGSSTQFEDTAALLRSRPPQSRSAAKFHFVFIVRRHGQHVTTDDSGRPENVLVRGPVAAKLRPRPQPHCVRGPQVPTVTSCGGGDNDGRTLGRVGAVAEWPNAPVLKTGDLTIRGFESLPLRQRVGQAPGWIPALTSCSQPSASRHAASASRRMDSPCSPAAG